MLDEWDSQLGSLQASDLDTAMGPLVSSTAAADGDDTMSFAVDAACSIAIAAVEDDLVDETIKTEETAEEDLKPDVFLTEAMPETAQVNTPPTSTGVSSSAAPSMICVRRPYSVASPGGVSAQTNAGRGLGAAGGVSRQLPVMSGGSAASALRSPVISRGICYTRTGGLGVTRYRYRYLEKLLAY